MKNIRYIYLFLLMCLVFVGSDIKAQVTGLSDYVLFIDPGHSQNENMGLYNYSEAEKVLRVAHELKAMLEQQTDIKKVHMSRLTDDDYISLSGRTDLANSLGADFYYSIHSDAGSPSANSTLTMYGGFNKDGVTIEKTPNGGKVFGEILCEDLTGAMRIPTRGNYADRVYYLGNEATHTNQWPYLYVNRTTNMASLLSEAGFHTNPMQQQLNLNSEWKKLEALSAFRSFLNFRGIDRPVVCVVAGIITDADTGMPVNGITVSTEGKTYVTDTYVSLFNKYSNDPEELRNGFYYIEDLTPGKEVELSFVSEQYQTVTTNATLISSLNGRTDENVTFVDVEVTSVVPAKVVSVQVSEGDLSGVMPGKDLVFMFSRKMDRTSVEQALSVMPEVPLSFVWKDDFTVLVNTDQMDFETDYTITIDGGVAKNSLTQQLLDGDMDGVAGGDYTVQLTTSPSDNEPPVVVQQWPGNTDMVGEIRPVIRIVFDEKLDAASVVADIVELKNILDETTVTGVVDHVVVNGQSVIHLFPSQDLINEQTYRVNLKAGLSDMFGNLVGAMDYTFTVHEQKINSLTIMDDFEAGIVSWWQPQASGSTSGIETESTSRVHEQAVVVKSLNSTGSMKLNYAWLVPGTGYIREYLPPSSTQNSNRFDTRHVLQMYVFGDGSNNKFRFVIKDGNSTYEASDWYLVDWIGWKLVSWDLTSATSVGWVNGDGVLDGSGFYLDGIHVAAAAGGTQYGTLYFDDLRFVERQSYVPTAVEKVDKSNLQVYPNPVSDILFIKSDDLVKRYELFDLSGRCVLSNNVDEESLEVDVAPLKGGIYILRISTSSGLSSHKIEVLN